MTMTVVEIRPEIFNRSYKAQLKNEARTQIYFGGSASGKSVFLAQRMVMDLMAGERNYLVVRQVGRTLRGSVFTETIKIISGWGVDSLFKVNRSDMLITCGSGCQAIFAGLDDVEKLKSITPAHGAITDVWVEEATEIERGSLKQLLKRQRGGSAKTPKRLSLSFNPVIKTHWIYDEYFSTIGWAENQTEYTGENLFILKTTYKDNRFLTEGDVSDLEGEEDSYFRDVYTLGNWGVLGNVIFKNWKVADLSDAQSEYYLPEAQRVNRRAGLDFGFSSDPAAMVFCHYDKPKKRIYIFGELYQRGLTNDVLAEQVLELINGDYVNCDSAEPKSIAELRKHGVNALSAKKGKDSIAFGIQWLQQQELIVDKACINMQNELSQYKWREDANGNAMRLPVDRNNHLIDGLRYAFEEDALELSVDYLPGLYK